MIGGLDVPGQFSIGPTGAATYWIPIALPSGTAGVMPTLSLERLIGSIRRECVDHIVVFDEAHLRRILRSYACYYNEVRTHRSLDKDAPVSRPVSGPGASNRSAS
jgi:integrase-like protein